MFLLHLRTSPVRLAVPILVALDVALLLLRESFWIGVWPDTGAVAQVSAYLLAPLIAGAAAWAATAPSRTRMTEQTRVARRHPVVVETYQLAATGTLLLIPYLAGQTCAALLTAPERPPGLALWFGYFTLGAFVTLFGFAIGWVTGKAFRSALAPVGALLACLLLLGAMDRWFGTIVVAANIERRVSLGVVAIRLVLVTALLFAVLWIPAAGPIGKRPAIATTAISAILLGAMATGNVLVERESPGSDATCTDGAITLCVWPEHQKYLSQLGEINDRVSPLPAVLTRPRQMNESGIDDGPTPSFTIKEGSVWSSAGDIATAILAKTFKYESDECRWEAQTAADAARGNALQAWLETHLAGGGTPDYETNAPAEMRHAWTVGRAQATERTTAAQFEWVTAEVADLYGHYCSRG
jgi:hypothetical protein